MAGLANRFGRLNRLHHLGFFHHDNVSVIDCAAVFPRFIVVIGLQAAVFLELDEIRQVMVQIEKVEKGLFVLDRDNRVDQPVRVIRIGQKLPGGLSAQEVVAESWPNESLIDAAVDCVASWRQSPGHWGAVKRRQPLFGYDMRLGRNGIWYATGIFGNRH